MGEYLVYCISLGNSKGQVNNFFYLTQHTTQLKKRQQINTLQRLTIKHRFKFTISLLQLCSDSEFTPESLCYGHFTC